MTHTHPLTSAAPRPAVFFDRDGVLNHDHGYIGTRERFDWIEGAIDAVKTANARGALAFMVTNQSGVARGYFPENAVVALYAAMEADLAAQGAWLDDWRYCPHLPDAPLAEYRLDCGCRKPKPGMILDLLRCWPADPARSVLIGDKTSDMEAAKGAGIRGLLYKGGPLIELVDGFLDGLPA